MPGGDSGERIPPFASPVFVLTHHAREPLEMKGATTFNFVSDGIEAALRHAEEVAGEKGEAFYPADAKTKSFLVSAHS